jgi:hypothetical protein
MSKPAGSNSEKDKQKHRENPKADVLLSIPAKQRWHGNTPIFSADTYLGYYDGAERQLVFVFDDVGCRGLLYFSTHGWDDVFVMESGRLPQNAVLTGCEAAWAMACWQAALFRHTRDNRSM